MTDRHGKMAVWWAILWTVLCASISEASEEPTLEDLTPEELQRRFVDSFEVGDFTTSLRYGEALAAHFPRSADLAFDLSRLRMINDDPESSLVWLERSIDAGFADVEKLDGDLDLDLLRSRPEYAGLRARMVENKRVAWESFKRRVAARPAKLWVPRTGNSRQPRPVIIALHGRGGRARTQERIWQPVAEHLGAVLATPQGLEGYAEGYEWGDLRETAYQVAKVIERVEAEYVVDPERIILTGFSQGGRHSIAIAFETPRSFAGVIAVGSAMDREMSIPSALTNIETSKPRFFLMVGADDRVLPFTRETSQRLAEHGIPNELAVYVGVGHDYPSDYRRQLLRATEFVLRP